VFSEEGKEKLMTMALGFVTTGVVVAAATEEVERGTEKVVKRRILSVIGGRCS